MFAQCMTIEAIKEYVADTPQLAALSRARFIAHIVRNVTGSTKDAARSVWNDSKFKRVRLLFRRTLARLRKSRPDKIETAISANPGTYQIDVLYFDTNSQQDEDVPPDAVSDLSGRMALVMVEIYSRRAYVVPITGRRMEQDIKPAYKDLLHQIEAHFKEMEDVREKEGEALARDEGMESAKHFPSFPPMPVSVIYALEGDKEFEPLRSFNDRPAGPSTTDQNSILTTIFVSKWVHNAERQGGAPLGIVDAFARTIKHMVRTYALTHSRTDWTAYLPDLVALYNSTPHSGIHQMSPDFVSLHPGVMWNQHVAKAAHTDKVEALLNDQRPHHTREDVEALQGIRKRYNYRLPGPLKVGDFVMVLKDKQSILTKGPRRNKYQVFVVHTVLRKNRYQVVKLADVKAKQLALTDAQWPDAIGAVGRVYAREELYKLSEEDKINVDDGTVEQELRDAVDEYREARADEKDAYDAADDEDEEGGDMVPDIFAPELQAEADKLAGEELLEGPDYLKYEQADLRRSIWGMLMGKRYQRMSAARAAEERRALVPNAFRTTRVTFFRYIAVADAILALEPDLVVYRRRQELVSELVRIVHDGTYEPPPELPVEDAPGPSDAADDNTQDAADDNTHDDDHPVQTEIVGEDDTEPAEGVEDAGFPDAFAGELKAEADRLVEEGIVGNVKLRKEFKRLNVKYVVRFPGSRKVSAKRMRETTQAKMKDWFTTYRSEQFRRIAAANALLRLSAVASDAEYADWVSRKRQDLVSFLESGEPAEPRARGQKRTRGPADVPEDGGLRETVRRTQEEVEGTQSALQSAQELEAAIRDAETRLATRFGFRMASGGTTAIQVLNNATARELYARLYALGVTLKDVGNKPPDFLPRYHNMLLKMQEWAGSDDRAPWEFEGFFESDLVALPDRFQEAVRTLYQREGYDETSDAPSADELHAWAEAAQREYEQHKMTKEADAKTVRSYLDVQVLWRAWMARRKASEWTGGDSEFTKFKGGPLRTLNRAAERYVTSVAVINEAVALGTEQRQVEAVVGREGRATRRRGRG